MNILRGKRLKEVKEEVARYTTSLSFDKEIFESDILCDIAHTFMLYKVGILKEDEAKKIIEGLKEIYKKGYENLNLDPSLDDIHMVIENELHKLVGDVAGKMHTGRSRNDQVATDLRLALREKLLEILELLLRMLKDLTEKAEEYKDVVTVGYTHLQHAQPITYGHLLLSYVSSILRDVERLLDCYKRVNISPLGCGALATTGFKIDRELTKELLGFDDLIKNSIDGVATRDFILETLSSLSILGTNLSKICEELILFSTYEFNTIEIADEYCSTSSIMPQKKNPDVAEIARAKLSSINGNLVTALTILKALPNAYNRDLQELTPYLWDSIYKMRDTIKMVHGMLKTLKINKERMEELAKSNYSTATELADTLVRETGISFRKAHNIVGEIVRKSIEEKRDIIEVAKEVLRHYQLEVSEDSLKKALDVHENVKLRGIIGGPAPKEVEERAKEFKEIIEKYKEEVEEKKEKIEKVKENLLNIFSR
ncbi:argininosuccinate lyase [Methanocaldococcus infernus ME]|uniref:Argininosuccinate lyase n=1 Tax=Methanocaldococcus infernus (strain DSM 11812 / JCM 15783 / ME) TaxID=573063 RepID=D5VSJ1_METIM|nr:argininosuccinate lyase [Methanocaldococcus infernus]ADG13544.1 argininosuccinate lyase [Methanocaldococcus infernus ME]